MDDCAPEMDYFVQPPAVGRAWSQGLLPQPKLGMLEHHLSSDGAAQAAAQYIGKKEACPLR